MFMKGRPEEKKSEFILIAEQNNDIKKKLV